MLIVEGPWRDDGKEGERRADKPDPERVTDVLEEETGAPCDHLSTVSTLDGESR